MTKNITDFFILYIYRFFFQWNTLEWYKISHSHPNWWSESNELWLLNLAPFTFKPTTINVNLTINNSDTHFAHTFFTVHIKFGTNKLFTAQMCYNDTVYFWRLLYAQYNNNSSSIANGFWELFFLYRCWQQFADFDECLYSTFHVIYVDVIHVIVIM